MSLILEALRKSEAERRRGGAPDLLQAEFAATSPRQWRMPHWSWAGVLLATAALVLLWPPASEPPSVTGAAPAVATPAQRTITASPAPAPLPQVAHLRPAPRVELAAGPEPAARPPARSPTASAPAGTQQPVPLTALAPSLREALPPLRLSMHLWNQDPSRRLAILDGHRVSAGDRVGDAVVAEITPAGVVLDWNGQRILVALP